MLLIWRFRGSDGFELVYHEEATGHLPFCLFLLLDSLAIDDRRMANVLGKERAERSEALKTHLETDVRHTEFVATQQFFRLLNASFNQILVWGLIEGLPEEPQEVVTREAGLFGNLVETKRVVVTVIDKLARPSQSLERVNVRQISVFDSSNHPMALVAMVSATRSR